MMSNLQEFANKLIANQEPLGEKFTEVLVSNLWELYEHKDNKNEPRINDCLLDKSTTHSYTKKK